MFVCFIRATTEVGKVIVSDESARTSQGMFMAYFQALSGMVLKGTMKTTTRKLKSG